MAGLLVLLTTGCAEGPLEAPSARKAPTVTLTGSLMLPASVTREGPLASWQGLAALQPLGGVALLAAVSPQGPAGPSSYRILADPGTGWAGDGSITQAIVQAIDVRTGQAILSGSADQTGRYRLVLAQRDFGHPLMLQTILRNASGQAVAFLAAPFQAADTAASREAELNLTPGTTLLAFSTVLLSEFYPSFDVRTGFLDRASTRLSLLVGAIDPTKLSMAAGILDQSKGLLSPPSLEVLLGEEATSSAVVTYHIKKLALDIPAPSSKAQACLWAALLGQFVDRLAAFDPDADASASAHVLDAVSARVDLVSALQEATSLQADMPPDPLPTLPPDPTLPPADVGVSLE